MRGSCSTRTILSNPLETNRAMWLDLLGNLSGNDKGHFWVKTLKKWAMVLYLLFASLFLKAEDSDTLRNGKLSLWITRWTSTYCPNPPHLTEMRISISSTALSLWTPGVLLFMPNKAEKKKNKHFLKWVLKHC